MPYKSNSNHYESETQGTRLLSLPGHLSTHTVLIFSLLINTSLVSLGSIFVGILFCKDEGPGLLSLTTGLLALTKATWLNLWLGMEAPLQAVAG